MKFETALLSMMTLSFAQTAEDKEKYPRWADELDKYKYTWEAFEVATEDDYILTLFHITGTEEGGKFTPSKEPVLIQHGLKMDAASWMKDYSEAPKHYQGGKPMPLQLADQGYDVWMGNNRGTMYSLGHKSLTVEDRAYWDWSWAQMGLYDTPANITEVKNQTGVDKIFYLGYSQGTVQIFYGLAHLEDSFYADNLLKVVTLAPCFVASKLCTIEMDTLEELEDKGVYNLLGPDWQTNLDKICEDYSFETCQVFKQDSGQCYSIQDGLHWAYNNVVNRFQEWASDYVQGKTETDLVPVESINKVPIAMFTGTMDGVCPREQALNYAKIIGDPVQEIYAFKGKTHGFWSYASDEDFMQKLVTQLQAPSEATIFTQ